MSVRASHCSGDMYSGVPAGASSLVVSMRSAPSLRTRPKSNSFAPSVSSMNTFSGFRSQCTRPRPCAISMTLRIASAWRENSSISIGPSSAARRSESTSALTNSITTYADPLASRPRSNTAGTWGTPTAASASASRSSASPAEALSARATLMATGCPSDARWARNTAPKPPCPSVLTHAERRQVGRRNHERRRLLLAGRRRGRRRTVRGTDGRGVADPPAASRTTNHRTTYPMRRGMTTMRQAESAVRDDVGVSPTSAGRAASAPRRPPIDGRGPDLDDAAASRAADRRLSAGDRRRHRVARRRGGGGAAGRGQDDAGSARAARRAGCATGRSGCSSRAGCPRGWPPRASPASWASASARPSAIRSASTRRPGPRRGSGS